jgi:cell wall arabinan synthesis protein/arabinosyltransferase-like concanavalin domain-containing protein
MALRERQERQTTGKSGATRRSDHRPALALGLGLAALACALIGAVGPAKPLQTTYSWPPAELPAGKPARLWYTPLLVSRHEPESISARLPCSLPPALANGADGATVLATAREPAIADALAVTRTGNRLVVRIGARTLATARLPAQASGPDCGYRLELGHGQWSFAGAGADKRGSLERMPVVVGLFSGLDLRAGTPPKIEVTTDVHGAQTRIHQTVFWLLGGLAAAAALLLVAFRRRPRPALRRTAKRVVGHLGLQDAVVGATLAAWWFIGPAFFDDGWVIARQRNFSASDGFSSYYSSFGVNLPLDYWLEWLQHWLVESSTSLLVLRIPALCCLAATWILARCLFARITAGTGNGVARWALACGFLACALSWGMTLRPEPVLAVLVTGVFLCSIRFVERQSAAPLALAAVLVVLALSAHPAGIVSLAPLLATAPTLARWARANLRPVGTIIAGAGALLTVLLTVGSDVGLRRAEVASLRLYGDETAGWRDELSRYSFLSQSPYGPPLRRESVALMVLAVLAYLLRRRRDRAGALLGLPAITLGLALVLLIATPTKWPWHFGTLIGIAAVAIAAETARLRADARSAQRWEVRPFVVLAAGVAAAAWAWSPRNSWGELDLRTLDWTLGFEDRVTPSKLGGAVPVAILAGLALFEFARARRRLSDVPWQAATWTVPALAVPVLAFTVAVLVADSAKTDSWTLARQNVQPGAFPCGLADDSVVPTTDSMRGLDSVGSAPTPSTAGGLPPPPVRNLTRLTLGPAPSRSTPARSPWFRLPAQARAGFFLTGTPRATDTLELEWGRAGQSGRIERLGRGDVPGDFAEDARPGMVSWRFYTESSLPARPAQANAVRIALRSDVSPGAVVGLTQFVRYETRPLTGVLQSAGSPALALPNLLAYVPCVKQPRVGGVAEAPGAIVAFRDSLWPLGTGTSPFDGLPDLYRIVRLPLSDSTDPPGDVAVYAVDRRIDGAAVARPVESRTN